MSAEDVQKRLTAIRRWSEGGERAAHKPMLLLLVLARLQRREAPVIDYANDEMLFRELMGQYGGSDKVRMEHPFWRLQNDGVWTVEPSNIPVNSRGDVSKSKLVEAGAVGRLDPAIEAALKADSNLVRRIVSELAGLVVGETQLEDLMDAIGMPFYVVTERDPKFRGRILNLYDEACAACGFSARLGSALLALEAAHVRWHAYGGPDDEDNGLALCSLHHKAFDAGAIGLDDDYRWLLSRELKGVSINPAVRQQLGELQQKQVRASKLGAHPALRHVRWHRKEVFRG